MYESMTEILVSVDKPILLMGDFNEVLHPDERTGSFRYDSSMRDFAEWVQDLYLIDVPLRGIRLTWGDLNPKVSLIDVYVTMNG